MIQIDGSWHEGGGQILRTSIALSAITGKPCRIFNIRAKRCNPGLAAQHLVGIKSSAEISNAKLKGAKIGSTEVEFHPGKIRGGSYKIDVGTAGSIPLVLQILVPVLLRADRPSEIELTGGTHVKWSPVADWYEHVLFYCLIHQFGIKTRMEIKKFGFYPKGGGLIKLAIEPKDIQAINILERGTQKRIDVWSVASSDLKNARVAERQLDGVKKHIPEIYHEHTVYGDSLSTGSSCHVHAHFENCVLGTSSLGERGKPAEKVGEEAALALKEQLEANCTVDEWTSDQLLPFMALAKNKSTIIAPRLTKHTETNIWAIKKFLDVDFKTTKLENGVKIECSGSKK